MGDLNGDADKRPLQVDVAQLHRISEVTIAHYDRSAEAYWNGTRDHDVSENYRSLLDAIEGNPEARAVLRSSTEGRSSMLFTISFIFPNRAGMTFPPRKRSR